LEEKKKEKEMCEATKDETLTCTIMLADIIAINALAFPIS